MAESVQQNVCMLKALAEFMPGMVGYWTRELRSGFASREYMHWFGKSPEQMKGISIQELLGPELYQKNEPYIRAALLGEVQEFERTLTLQNLEKRDTLAYYIPHCEDGLVLGFFVLILDITERKRLERAMVSVAEEHQRSIGQELHDNLGQQLAAIAYQASALEKLVTGGAAQLAASIAAQAQGAVMQCKQYAQGLLPFELEANGLKPALQAYAARISGNYGVSCTLQCDDNVAIEDAELALNLYRIAQEAVFNAIRHGKARHLTLSLQAAASGLRLSIRDDGAGFAEGQAKHGVAGGMGIKIMRYRASQYGATLKFLSPAAGGAEVLLEMPGLGRC